jgi:hypothetical protein
LLPLIFVFAALIFAGVVAESNQQPTANGARLGNIESRLELPYTVHAVTGLEVTPLMLRCRMRSNARRQARG